MAQAYPLAWPDSMPRCKSPRSSQFKATLHAALENVHDELRRFGNDSGKPVKDVLISSNYTLGDHNPKDSGVAVYFSWDGISTCIAVDQYTKLQENLQAIYHVLNAERTKLRHGGLNIVRAAFRGYAALPPPVPQEDWHAVLNLPAHAPTEAVKKQYQALRSATHPDRKGGDASQFDRVQKAWEQFCRERGL